MESTNPVSRASGKGAKSPGKGGRGKGGRRSPNKSPNQVHPKLPPHPTHSTCCASEPAQSGKPPALVTPRGTTSAGAKWPRNISFLLLCILSFALLTLTLHTQHTPNRPIAPIPGWELINEAWSQGKGKASPQQSKNQPGIPETLPPSAGHQQSFSDLGQPQVPMQTDLGGIGVSVMPHGISQDPPPEAVSLYATQYPIRGPPGRGEGNYYDMNSSAVMNSMHVPRLEQTRWISLRYVAGAGVELNTIVASWGQVVQGVRHVQNGDTRTGLAQVAVAALTTEGVQALMHGSVACSEADGGVVHLRVFVKSPPLSPKSVEVLLSEAVEPVEFLHELSAQAAHEGILLTSDMRAVYASSAETLLKQGVAATQLATLLLNDEYARAAKLRLVGKSNGKPTHLVQQRHDQPGRFIARADPKQATYTTHGIELRAKNNELVEIVHALAGRTVLRLQAERDHAIINSQQSIGMAMEVSAIPPKKLDGYVWMPPDNFARIKNLETGSEYAVMANMGCLAVSLADLYNLTVGCGPVLSAEHWTVSETLQLRDRPGQVNVKMARICFSREEGMDAALAMDGVNYRGQKITLVKDTVESMKLVPAEFTRVNGTIVRAAAEADPLANPYHMFQTEVVRQFKQGIAEPARCAAESRVNRVIDKEARDDAYYRHSEGMPPKAMSEPGGEILVIVLSEAGLVMKFVMKHAVGETLYGFASRVIEEAVDVEGAPWFAAQHTAPVPRVQLEDGASPVPMKLMMNQEMREVRTTLGTRVEGSKTYPALMLAMDFTDESRQAADRVKQRMQMLQDAECSPQVQITGTEGLEFAATVEMELLVTQGVQAAAAIMAQAQPDVQQAVGLCVAQALEQNPLLQEYDHVKLVMDLRSLEARHPVDVVRRVTSALEIAMLAKDRCPTYSPEVRLTSLKAVSRGDAAARLSKAAEHMATSMGVSKWPASLEELIRQRMEIGKQALTALTLDARNELNQVVTNAAANAAANQPRFASTMLLTLRSKGEAMQQSDAYGFSHFITALELKLAMAQPEVHGLKLLDPEARMSSVQRVEQEYTDVVKGNLTEAVNYLGENTMYAALHHQQHTQSSLLTEPTWDFRDTLQRTHNHTHNSRQPHTSERTYTCEFTWLYLAHHTPHGSDTRYQHTRHATLPYTLPLGSQLRLHTTQVLMVACSSIKRPTTELSLRRVLLPHESKRLVQIGAAQEKTVTTRHSLMYAASRSGYAIWLFGTEMARTMIAPSIEFFNTSHAANEIALSLMSTASNMLTFVLQGMSVVALACGCRQTAMCISAVLIMYWVAIAGKIFLEALTVGRNKSLWYGAGKVQLIVMLLLMGVQATAADTGAVDEWGPSVSPFLLPAGVVGRSVWKALEEEIDGSRSMDWKDMLAEIQESSDMPQCSQYAGDDVTQKGACTGCRLITLNANKSLMSSDYTTGQSFAHEFSRVLASREADVAVVHEPGITDWGTAESVLNSRMGDGWRYRYIPRATSAGRQGAHGGVLLVLRPQWEAALATDSNTKLDRIDQPYKGRESDKLVAIEFCNPLIHQPSKARRHNERMLLLAVHGFNTGSDRNKPWGNNTSRHEALMTAVRERMGAFRGAYPKASVVLAGDLNFASVTSLDTAEGEGLQRVGVDDMHADTTTKGSGHQMAAEPSGLGLIDMFRQLNPWTVAVSRHPIGDQSGASRRLDQIWVTAELAESPVAQCAIDLHEGSLHTDHRMLTCDLPINVANTAGTHLSVWDPVVQRKLKILPGVQHESSDGRKAYAARMIEWCGMREAAAAPEGSLNSRLDSLQGAMQCAATGTVMQVVRTTSPKWVTRVKDMTTADWKLSRRRAHLRNLIQMVRLGASEDDVQSAVDKVPKAPAMSDEAKQKIGLMATADCLKEMLTAGEAEALSAVREECAALDKYLSAQSRNERARAAREKVSERRALFDEGKVRATVQAVYRQMAPVRAITRLVAGNGAVLTAADLISAHVQSFVTDWFKSKVHVSSRFGSMEAVYNWDKSQMDARAKAAVEMFYEAGDKSASYYREHPEFWGGWNREFDMDELEAALRQFSAGKSPGPSQLQAEMFKWLPIEAKLVLLQLLDDCRKSGEFPSHANAGLMWLLPKGEAGKKDLNKTRPIALMETVAKIYERLWYNRIIAVITAHDMLDPAQYGGVPGGGTADPMQVLACVLDDARLSKSQLHCLSLDLSKAFDTVEYWSQAASWAALGMPPGLIRLLIQMDSGATTQVALGGGRYTDPVAHGRGVRQGSIMGPLKWVAFMHWWIHGVKHQMKGQGYTMQCTAGGEPVEVQAQMLIDDSNWFTHSAESMQRCVFVIEEWVWLHGLIVNRSKTELITTGVSTTATPIYWSTGARLVSVGAEHACRYLGAWYEAGGRWAEQQRVTSSRLDELLSPIAAAARTLSMGEVRYLLNSKVMPALLYPTQVAIFPTTFLRAVDTEIRGVFNGVAGVSGCDVPIEYYYVDVSAGGYGLTSFEKQYHASTVGNWVQYMNKSRTNMAGRVIEASVALHKRTHTISRSPFTQPVIAPHTPSTQVGKLLHSLRTLELCMHTSDSQLCNSVHAFTAGSAAPQYAPQHVSEHLDVEAADSCEKRGLVEVYTDGSTEGADTSIAEAGWGCVAFAGDQSEMVELWRASGRVAGKQDNFYAESEALLQALLRVHTEDNVVIGCDNATCVNMCCQEEAHNQRTVADALSMPARCTWNRIWALIRHRAAKKASTQVHWVHSHVDVVERQVVTSADLTCMCHLHYPSAGSTGRCNPGSRAHVGNKAADEAADEGRKQLQLDNAEDDLSLGEIRCTLVDPARGRLDLPVKSVVLTELLLLH